MHTLLDIAKLNNSDREVGLIEENLKFAPELNIFPSRTVAGTNYKTAVRTSLPSVGFRAANSGTNWSKSGLSQKLTELMIISSIVGVDKAVASAHEDGMAAYEMLEADGVYKSSLLSIGSQIFEGTTADAAGFTGLKAATPFADTSRVINAGGSTASTASSIYFVVFGLKDCHLVFGQDTTLELSEFRDQVLLDADGKPYAGRVADMTGWAGLHIGNLWSVVRIANVTADSGKGCTDALLSRALALFPTGQVPSAIFMSRRSRSQLQQARTVTLFGNSTSKPDGASQQVAPLPTSFENIPIVATDSIPDTSAIES